MSDRFDRLHDAADDHPRDQRDPGRRDRDRILYSTAFRRLAGITQVASANDRHPIHNRLTHTLEVAQIGRSLAEQLLRERNYQDLIAAAGGLDPDVVEAACLAHDLGHPPFGHVAEAELDRLVKQVKAVDGGFEGNPQTFRILTRLGVRYPNYGGLNLTRATLCAVLKYPWLRGTDGIPARKWGAYASEEDDFHWACAMLPEQRSRSLEADLMDWADDVAYAVHDVEDFYRAGIIPLDWLMRAPAEQERFIQAELTRNVELQGYDEQSLKDYFQDLLTIAPLNGPYTGSRESRARLRSFTSSLVDRYINAVTLAPRIGDGGSPLQVSLRPHIEVLLLKGLTWQYVIESPALITQRYGHKRLIESLFLTLCDAGSSAKDRRVFPTFFQQMLGDSASDSLVVRTVADFIASLTEAQVVAMHHRLTGISMGASLDPILP